MIIAVGIYTVAVDGLGSRGTYIYGNNAGQGLIGNQQRQQGCGQQAGGKESGGKTTGTTGEKRRFNAMRRRLIACR